MSATRDEERGLEAKTTPADSDHSDPPSEYNAEKDSDPENNFDASPPEKEEQVRQITGVKVQRTIARQEEDDADGDFIVATSGFFFSPVL